MGTNNPLEDTAMAITILKKAVTALVLLAAAPAAAGEGGGGVRPQSTGRTTTNSWF
jgi:hypothetical protein